MPMVISYELGTALYINVTNRCSNSCEFCVRTTQNNVNGIDELWLDREPTVAEIQEDLTKRNLSKYSELVFCGFGEPFERFSDVMEICRWLRENYPSVKIRVNTNGHAILIAGRNVTQEMKGLVDTLSISLNAKNAQDYNKICRCEFGEKGFTEMLNFASESKKYVPKVILTVVDVLPKEDIAECAKIAKELSVDFRVREKY